MTPVIEAYLETVGVVSLAGLGAAGGWLCSKRRRIWAIGYIVPLAFLIFIAFRGRLPWVETLPPFEWITAGRRQMALMGPMCMLVLMTLLPRLPRRNTRILFSALMFLCTISYSILPFLLPVITSRSFARLVTTRGYDGVCLQSCDYTCGPAAAVTSLDRIGIHAEEGELAILSRTTRVTGTLPDCLCRAIRDKYDIDCREVFFKTVDEMRGREPVIAVIKYNFFCDHFVTVLQVTDSTVVVGDPLVGRTELTFAQFLRKWRCCGIVLDGRGEVLPSAR